MVVKLVGLIDEYRISNSSSSSCLVCYGLLSLLACLGCTERSVRLASTTITSTPTSVNDVEVRWISKTKGEYCYGRAIQGGVTHIEPIQTLSTGGFDRLDRPLTPNLGGVVKRPRC